MSHIDYAMLVQPMPGEKVSGDIALVKKTDNHLLLCLIDVAGHGVLANELAETSVKIVDENSNEELIDIIEILKTNLKGTRGLVIGLASIEINSGLVLYVGMGNIRTRVIGTQSYHFTTRVGVIGVSNHKPVVEKYLLNSHDILLMYSDGVEDRFNKSHYPDIMEDPIEFIPGEIIKRFSKKIDDASCIAARFYL